MLLSMLLQDTPNTVNYMIAGYIVLVGMPILYVITWFVRQRNLERDLETLETLSREPVKQ